MTPKSRRAHRVFLPSAPLLVGPEVSHELSDEVPPCLEFAVILSRATPPHPAGLRFGTAAADAGVAPVDRVLVDCARGARQSPPSSHHFSLKQNLSVSDCFMYYCCRHLSCRSVLRHLRAEPPCLSLGGVCSRADLYRHDLSLGWLENVGNNLLCDVRGCSKGGTPTQHRLSVHARRNEHPMSQRAYPHLRVRS